MATGYMINRSFKSIGLFNVIAICIICFHANAKADSGNNSNPVAAVKHQSLLDVLSQAEAVKDKKELIKTFGAFSKSDKLETVAYALQENLYPDATERMIRDDKELQDKCLVKYLPGFVEKNKDNGPLLFNIVRLIENYFPDPNLVPALLDYAGQSDYSVFSIAPSVGRAGSETRYFSVIEEISLILFKISKGKIRNVDLSKRVNVESSQREALITQWRAEWPKVHQELLEEERELRMEIRPVDHKEIIDLLIEMQSLREEQKQVLNETYKPENERTITVEEENNLIKAQNKKSKNILAQIRSKKRNDKLETIAYAMTEGLYLDAVMYFVAYDEDIHDKRLVPFIAQTIKNSTDKKLYAAVFSAYVIPEKSLLPLLLGHGLDNDYVSSYLPHKNIPDNSIFLTAAKAIYKITNGKIGHNMIGTNEEKLYNQKDALIKQWRQTWQEEQNKSN